MSKGKRRRVREPAADPFAARKLLTVRGAGSLGEQPGDIESRRAHALFVVIDPDEVSGLRKVLERQKAGHDFDVITRCGVGMPDDSAVPPAALLDIAIPEANLALELALDVDEYRHSLLEGIRSRALVLMDADTLAALQVMPSDEALRTGLAMWVPLFDTRALMGVLQQRVDLPLPVYRPVSWDLNESNHDEAVERFIEGAALPDFVAIQYREADTPSIVIAETSIAARAAAAELRMPLDGRWGVLSGETRSALRLDVFHNGEPFGAWIIPNPDVQLIRAGAGGSHHVMLLAEPLAADQDEAETQWADGVSVWVEHVEALRALLISLMRSPPTGGGEGSG